MKEKLPVIFLVLALTISACGTQPPIETAAPTVAESQAAATTESPTVTTTETQSPQTSVTSTPETPAPTNPPDCTNSAAFVADVTIPDNSDIPASTNFTKTWRVKNTGTCVWGPDYTLTSLFRGENVRAILRAVERDLPRADGGHFDATRGARHGRQIHQAFL